jgi:hypothetical protein
MGMIVRDLADLKQRIIEAVELNTSHADKHVAKALKSFRYLSSHNSYPH